MWLLKILCIVGIVKASLNGRTIVAGIRPETGRATHEQGEHGVTTMGGPNPLAVQHEGMTCA